MPARAAPLEVLQAAGACDLRWIEVIYHTQRRHSSLGMLDPVTYDRTRHNGSAA